MKALIVAFISILASLPASILGGWVLIDLYTKLVLPTSQYTLPGTLTPVTLGAILIFIGSLRVYFTRNLSDDTPKDELVGKMVTTAVTRYVLISLAWFTASLYYWLFM